MRTNDVIKTDKNRIFFFIAIVTHGLPQRCADSCLLCDAGFTSACRLSGEVCGIMLMWPTWRVVILLLLILVRVA